ncbi:hypothetical protein LO772_34460 [Yinghuangia sp. ASG 101]|uniref:hypothetical protein n=1 Tax=Yinghuangia sp. ASG 101 TaxID=2896848 RepID=UPI001E460A35|nr:hypothetical protein [Yinghuangia sp. ASG 101]UGQ11815.1 hypothetical protein LO772_34460 [Yinghuangia sp. ASG 101]
MTTVSAPPQATGESDTVTMYTAELHWQDGKYILTVHDHLTDTTHTTRVARRIVDGFPSHLAALDRLGS